MQSRDRFTRAIIALPLAALLVAACRDQKPVSADAALAQDLALAKQTASPVIPADTALRAAPTAAAPRRAAAKPDVSRRPAPRPVAAAPAPTPAPVAPTKGTIATGTALALTVSDRLCVSGAQPGDKLIAIVDQAVTGSNGATIPAGSKVVLEVASAVAGEHPSLSLRAKSVLANGVTYDLAGKAAPDSLDRVRTTSRGNDAKKVVGGAALGALAGQLLGKNTQSTVIGAAVGAAAGTAVAASTGTYDSCVPSGGHLKLVLTSPVAVALN
ncbi:MAG: hypothetical protein NVS9B3_00490 [Gemmatimonadaceae bacterium]